MSFSFQNQEIQQFFALIRLALEGTYDEILSEPIDWSAIYKISEEQAVLGTILVGIERMPKHKHPYMDLLMDWLGQVEYFRIINETLDNKCAELTQRYAQDGFTSCILKGQSNSCLYPKDIVRTPGDIDILISHKKSEGVYANRHYCIRYLRNVAPKCAVQYHHAELPIEDGVSIEVHYTPVVAFTPGVNKRIQQYFWKERIGFLLKELNFFRLHNVPDAIFQMMHIFKHLIIEGIGMRQVEDYYWLLKSMSAEERKRVAALLPQFRLQHFAGALMFVLQECCGLQDDYLIAEPDTVRGNYFFSEICAGGNFGRYNHKKGRRTKGKVRNFIMITSLAFRNFHYFPIESLFSPITRYANVLWLICHGYYLNNK